MTTIKLGSHDDKWVRYTLDHAVETGEPVNEVQTLTIAANGGTFDATILGHAMTLLPFDVSTTAFKAAYVAAGGGASDITITGGVGNVGGTTPYVITYGGASAGVNVAELTADATNLTGGAHTATPATQTAGGTAVVLTLRDEHGNATKLPDNCVILGWYIEPATNFTTPGGTPTIKLGLDDSGLGDDLFQAATNYNDAAFLTTSQTLSFSASAGDGGYKVSKSGGTAVIATVAAADISAGKLHLHVNVRAGV